MEKNISSFLKCVKFLLLRTLDLFIIPGITNYEEYSLIQESIEEKKEESTGTLKKDRTLLRDERKMEKLKAKLHTDDDCEYVFQGNSLINIFPQYNAKKPCMNAFLDYSVCFSWFLAVFCMPLYVVLSAIEYF